MARIRYCSKFFKSKQEALAFRRNEKGGSGAFYSNASGSKTRSSYRVEADMRGLSEEERKEYPYVIAWNETVA